METTCADDRYWVSLKVNDVLPADRPNTIHHWQLRDLLSCVEDDAGLQTLYTVCDRTTVSYDVASEQVGSEAPSFAFPLSASFRLL